MTNALCSFLQDEFTLFLSLITSSMAEPEVMKTEFLALILASTMIMSRLTLHPAALPLPSSIPSTISTLAFGLPSTIQAALSPPSSLGVESCLGTNALQCRGENRK